ncbi:hypothetical protein KGQ31_03470 [Patescibacteria group bacterium]|nr:hypothetical protein [Patescibacteria group bacterium]
MKNALRKAVRNQGAEPKNEVGFRSEATYEFFVSEATVISLRPKLAFFKNYPSALIHRSLSGPLAIAVIQVILLAVIIIYQKVVFVFILIIIKRVFRMKKLSASLLVGFAPLLALAQTNSATDAFSLVKILQNIVDVVIPFIVGLAVLVFLYGLFQFISSAGDEEARANAKQLIIWSIIGIFVMVSVWGLVNILSGTFNLNKAVTIPVSTVPVPRPTN